MPPRNQQAKHNPLKKENEPPTLATASSAVPFLGPSDYKTQQQEELETLRAIYAEDFEQVEGKAAAWGVSSFDQMLTPQADRPSLEICRSGFQHPHQGQFGSQHRCYIGCPVSSNLPKDHPDLENQESTVWKSQCTFSLAECHPD
jgi:hypothetical protein